KNENKQLVLKEGVFGFDQRFSTTLHTSDWRVTQMPVGGSPLSGDFVFSGFVSGDVKKQPLLETMDLELRGNFDDLTFDRQWVRRGQGNVLLSQGLWQFKNLLIETGDSIFEGDVELTATEFKSLSVLPRTRIYLSDVAYLRNLLPGAEAQIFYDGTMSGMYLNPDLNGKLKILNLVYRDRPLLDVLEMQIEKKD